MVSADGPGAPSLGGQFFDDFYREQGEDPWGFTDRWYEQRKRAVTLASLPRPRFRRALEVGCSIGVLTSDLAPRCDALLALDVAGAAVALARERTRALPSVRVEQMAVPAQWPEGTFDLVVLSEVGYYLSLDELTSLCDRSIGSLSPDGVLVACHWRHPVDGVPPAGRHRARGAAVPDRGGVAGPPRGGGLPPGRARPAAGGERRRADRPAGLTVRTSAACVAGPSAGAQVGELCPELGTGKG